MILELRDVFFFREYSGVFLDFKKKKESQSLQQRIIHLQRKQVQCITHTTEYLEVLKGSKGTMKEKKRRGNQIQEGKAENIGLAKTFIWFFP